MRCTCACEPGALRARCRWRWKNEWQSRGRACSATEAGPYVLRTSCRRSRVPWSRQISDARRRWPMPGMRGQSQASPRGVVQQVPARVRAAGAELRSRDIRDRRRSGRHRNHRVAHRHRDRRSALQPRNRPGSVARPRPRRRLRRCADAPAPPARRRLPAAARPARAGRWPRPLRPAPQRTGFRSSPAWRPGRRATADARVR